MAETSKTKLLSLLDPYLKEFQATVIAKRPVEEGEALILNQTAFHPQGGGQDSDRGLISGQSGRAEVIAVRELDDIYHIIGNLNGRIEVDDLVRGEIDWSRRYGLMKNHTAGHILWAALEKTLPGMSIAGAAVTADKVRFDVQTDREQLREELGEIEASANRVVAGDRTVKIMNLGRAEAVEMIRRYGESTSIIPPDIEIVRIVEIERWDISACKGLHVKTTREVGTIKFLKRISKGKNIDRIEFAAT